MIKIGNLNLNGSAILAPMAGVTDRPFRTICKSMGAGLVYTEFVSADGVIRKNLKTLDLIRFNNDERPIGVQIFGDDPEVVSKSASLIENQFNPDIIDINYGCPVPKVTNRGAGSAALKDLCLMEDITSAVVENVKNTPITVKMRAGWDNNNIVSTEAGIRLEKIGVKAITLHPRTTKQMFTKEANWELIKELKESISIPVIGNGDVKSVNDYIEIKEKTNCDAVMIARASLGNPWIFLDIYNYENNIKNEKIHLEDKIKLCKTHFELLKEDKNSNQCVNLAKKHFSFYLKGFDGAGKWRKKFMSLNNQIEIQLAIEELIKHARFIDKQNKIAT